MSFLTFLRDNAQWLMAGVLLSFLSSFGQTFFISIFAGEIRDEFGLSNGQWGGIYTLGTGLSAVVMVWAGALTDRFRARALGFVVLVLLALACVAMSVSRGVVMLIITVFLLRFAGQGMTSHIAIVAMSRWFVAARGRALSIAVLGFALGEAMLPLAFVALKRSQDWRDLWLAAAGIVMIGMLVLMMLLRRERTPKSIAETSASPGMEGRHWTRSQALHHWLFWLMIPVIMGPPAFVTTFFFHQVHFAQTKGWDHVALVALYPAYTAIGMAFVFAWGALLDRVGTGRLLPFAHLPAAAAFAIFGMVDTVTGTAVGLVCLAVTIGAQSTLPMAFWAEYFGTRNIGSIKAMAAGAMVLGSALGPGIAGTLIDAGIDIQVQYLGIAAWFLAGSLAMAVGLHRARGLLATAP
ncbi:MAG: MFS transporter [Pseudooceanicola sp.]